LAARTGLLVLVLIGLPAPAQPVALTVDLAAPRQSFLGFGATLKPLVYGGADYLSPAERQAALDAAIREVGISTGSLELTVERLANDNADPFAASAAGFDFAFHQQAVTAIVAPGAPLGLSDWYPGSRIDLRYSHAWMAPVRAANYDRYLDEVAENVLQQLVWWRDTYGRVPALLQLFNEPTTGNQELRNPNPGARIQEVVDLVKRVGARVRAGGFDTVRFVVPNEETVAASRATAEAVLSDPEARPYVGAVAYHPYPYGSPYASPGRILAESGAGTPNADAVAERQAIRALADQYGVPTWMTEVSEGPGTNEFPAGSVEEVRARAIHIHDEILYAGASAFYGMHLLWDQRSHAEHFGGSCRYEDEESSIVLIDNDDCQGDGRTGNVTITGIGYAIGHYARWVAPGSVVVATTSTDPLVQVTGFRDAAARRLALVLVNNRPEAVAIAVALSGGTPGGAVTGEASYANVRWGPAPVVDVAGGRLSVTLPPRSVVSLGVPLAVPTSGSPGADPRASSLAVPYPNPASGSADVSFTLARAGAVRLDVVDGLGRTVAVLVNGARPAGAYASRLPSGLPAGRYLLRLRAPGSTVTAPWTVAH
jgi:O-glycosyl hydrolase